MRKIGIYLIKFYQKYISPIFHFLGVECKYYPTCSQYALEAIEKYGLLKGVFLAGKRILKCNPFSKGGYDPLK